MAREDLDAQLSAVRGALVDLTGVAGDAMRLATRALLDPELALAGEVKAADARIDAGRLTVEDRTYELMARHAPVASDLRACVSAIRIGTDIDRMGSLAHHVAKVAQLRYPTGAVPSELVPVFREMGEVAGRMAAGAGAVLAARDASEASRLDVDDDAMDGLYRILFRALLGDWPYGVEAAIDVALLGRYYERFADHAVAIADTVVYLVTGVVRDAREEHLG